MKNPFTQPTFRGNKSRLLLLISAILLVFNTFAKLLPPPPTPTVVVTLPSGANCFSSLTASGCDVGNTVYWYNNGSSFYNTGATITASSSLPLYLTAKCYDSGTGTFGSASVENKVFPAGYTELSPKTTQSLCAAVTSVLFNASSATSGLTYQWRKGFSNVSGAVGSSYSATTTGTYDVVATSGSCTYTSPSVQVVNATVPFISKSISGSCGSKTLNLNVYNVSGGTFQWKLNGTNISGATASSYSAPITSTAASYTVDYTSGGCVTTSLPSSALPTITLTPAVSPACSATLTSTGCSSYTVWFKYNGSNWVYENYTYSPYSFPVSSTASDYKAICEDFTYCADIASNTVTAVPTNYTTISPTNSSVCSTGSVLLTANSTFSGLTYQWKLGGTNISGATSSTYSATTGGNYSVVTTSGACSFTSGNSVVTSVTPPSISITSSVSSPATITNGQSLVLTSNGCISSGGTVVWSNGGTTSAITVTPSSNTNYTFICTKSPCVVTSSAFVVNVNPNLPPTLMSSSPSTCTGTSVTLTVTGCTGGTITWSTLPAQTGTSISVSPSITTSYTAACTIGAVTSANSLPLSISVFDGVITSLASGNWNTPATWSCNCVPAACNDVIVDTGHVVTIPATEKGRLKNLTLRGTVDVKTTGTMALK